MSEIQKTSLKKINMQKIFTLLYEEGSLSQTDIREMSGLSGPTVSACLQYFKKNEVFIDGEVLASSGGRKPRQIAFNYDLRYGVGVEIGMNHADVRILNMKGNLLSRSRFRLHFSHNDEYWNRLSQLVEEEISIHVDRRRVLGVGIAFPGEVSLDGQSIKRATIFGLRDIPVSDIQKHFDLPIRVEYGPNAAGFGMAYRHPGINGCVYLVITNNGVAGSLIHERQILRGKSGEAAAFGHLMLDEPGKPCFYGSDSTWSNFCAVSQLTQQEDPDLPTFFQALDSGDESARKAWHDYVKYMARGLAVVKICFDTDIIIAGHIAPYLQEHYDELREEVSRFPAFRDEQVNLIIDTTSSSPMAEGAAMLLIADYVDNYIENVYE
jgi:predicted NBD/HSP70 family sugar kinase